MEVLSAYIDLNADELENISPSSFPYVDYDFVLKPNVAVTSELFKSRKHFIDTKGIARAVLDFSQHIRLSRSGNKTRGLLCAAIPQSDIHHIEKTLK